MVSEQFIGAEGIKRVLIMFLLLTLFIWASGWLFVKLEQSEPEAIENALHPTP